MGLGGNLRTSAIMSGYEQAFGKAGANKEVTQRSASLKVKLSAGVCKVNADRLGIYILSVCLPVELSLCVQGTHLRA